MAASDAQNPLAAALDRMWIHYMPLMRERVGILETAAQDFEGGGLSAEQREAAGSAAHKLAGICGTFGLARGTELARELEISYSQPGGPERSKAARLASTAAELRNLIESRK